MSEPHAPNEIISAAVDPYGPTHVGVFLAKALGHGQNPPKKADSLPDLTGTVPSLEPRADLLKCPGGQLACCASRSRGLAPAALEHQRWIEPAIGTICGYYADVDRVRSLYGPMSDHIKAVLAENHALKGCAPA